MKKGIFFLLTLLCIAPGCKRKKGGFFRKSQPVTAPIGNQVSSKQYQKTSEGHFDEDVEAFDLEEESNPFDASSSAQSPNDQVNLLDNEDSAVELVDKSTESSRQGFKTIYYRFNQYVLDPDQYSAADHNLQRIKSVLKTDPSATFLVTGHADNAAGSDAYNLSLSYRRAQEYQKYLSKKGNISTRKLKIVGRGSEMPIVIGGDKNAQAPNRRVEVTIRQSKNLK